MRHSYLSLWPFSYFFSSHFLSSTSRLSLVQCQLTIVCIDVQSQKKRERKFYVPKMFTSLFECVLWDSSVQFMTSAFHMELSVCPFMATGHNDNRSISTLRSLFNMVHIVFVFTIVYATRFTSSSRLISILDFGKVCSTYTHTNTLQYQNKNGQ